MIIWVLNCKYTTRIYFVASKIHFIFNDLYVYFLKQIYSHDLKFSRQRRLKASLTYTPNVPFSTLFYSPLYNNRCHLIVACPFLGQ